MKRKLNLERELECLEKQEELLQFDRFDNSTAWELGLALKEMCEKTQVAVTIEIRLCRETVFFYAMPGTSPNNSDWARRKRNTVELMQLSSYAVGLSLERDGEALVSKVGLPLRDFASHGGSFPIRVRGIGCVGVATISGLPQRDDHCYVTNVIAAMLGLSLNEFSLA